MDHFSSYPARRKKLPECCILNSLRVPIGGVRIPGMLTVQLTSASYLNVQLGSSPPRRRPQPRRASREDAQGVSWLQLGLLGLALVASIITVVVMVNRSSGAAHADDAGASDAPPLADMLDLTLRPNILFQVFGPRDQPRLLPVAALSGGKLKPIVLDADGWRRFDAMYMRKGKSYTLYRDGNTDGTAHVVRGMWDNNEPLYELANCRNPIPLATVRLEGYKASGFAVEMLASSAQLGWQHAAQPAHSANLAASMRRATADAVDASLLQPVLDSLESRALAIPTGAGAAPTLVAWWIDSVATSGTSSKALTRHMFVIADKDATGSYRATFAHKVFGPLGETEFRRYLDHLDLTGDGVDEIILEGWRFGGKTYLAILGFQAGKWKEVFRSPPDWCVG